MYNMGRNVLFLFNSEEYCVLVVQMGVETLTTVKYIMGTGGSPWARQLQGLVSAKTGCHEHTC